MIPDESYRHLGLLAGIVSGVGLTVLVRRVKAGRSVTLSLHAVSSRETYLFFAVSLTLGSGLLWLFNLNWFSPALNLPPAFSIFLALGIIFTLITAWVPDTKGWMRSAHRSAAYGIVLAILPITVTILLYGTISALATYVIVAGLAALITMEYMLFFVKSALSHIMLYQGLYMGVFFVSLMAATYL